MTLEEMRIRKRQLGYTYDMIAELSGLPVSTVQKVFLEITKSPRYETLQALESVLKPPEGTTITSKMYGRDIICEDKVPYGTAKQERLYTIADYYALPEEERVELIDGVFYDLAAPTNEHQMISVEITARFREYVRKKKGKCVVLQAPVDVQLDSDDKTMVQPDVMIICDRKKFQDDHVIGAPDLVVEVLSPSTRKKDIGEKGKKYENAGVREYWIVDPKKKRVHVYYYEDDALPTMYTFADKVPVGIWNNECEVDFAEIYDYISFLYEE